MSAMIKISKRVSNRFSVTIVLLSLCISLPCGAGDTNSLIRELGSPTPSVREAAARSLASSKSPEALTALIAALGDKDPGVRVQVRESLGKIGTTAVEPLLLALKHPDADVRVDAAWALARIADRRAVGPLIAALDDSTIQGEVIRSLRDFKDPTTVEPLLRILRTSSYTWDVIYNLKAINDPRIVPMLINTLNDHALVTRDGAAFALGAMGGSKAVAPLISAVTTDPDVEVRRAAAFSLGELRDSRAVDPLIGALRDPELRVRQEAIRALLEFEDRRLVPLFVSAFGDETLQTGAGDRTLRFLIAERLAKARDQMATETLTSTLRSGRLEQGERLQVIIALGEIADGRAVATLIPFLTEWSVNEEVAVALTKIGWKPATGSDEIHFLVAQRKGAELVRNWDRTRAILLKDVESRDPIIIQNALFAFVAIGNKEIVQTLVQTLDSRGDRAMAEGYLNCGQTELRKAAEDWAEKHGYHINSTYGSAQVVWGSMR